MFLVKLLLANAVIVACVEVGRRYPTLAGLIATMPLTTLIVLVWLHAEKPDDQGLLVDYARGVLWGILPSIAFFLVAYLCFSRRIPFPITLLASFGAWLTGAFLHRWLLA